MNSFSQVLWTAISQNALERNRKPNYKSCFHQSAAAGGSPNTLKRPKHVKRTSASWSKMLSCCFFGSCVECWAMGVTVVQYRYSIIEATLALHQFLSFQRILRLLLHSPVDFKLVKPILCLQVQPAQFPRSYPSWRRDPLHLWDVGFTIWTRHSSVPMDDAVLVQFCKNRCGFWVTSRFKVVINIHKSWFVFGGIPATILQKYRWSQWWWSSTVATMASSPSIIAEHQ